MCGVIKRSEITSRSAEREALFSSQGDSPLEFCSDRSREHQDLSGAKVQLSFGGSMDRDAHGSFLRVHQDKIFLFTLLLLQDHTSTQARARQRCIFQVHPDANVISIKDFQGPVFCGLNCRENQQRPRVFHQHQPHLGASSAGKERPKPTVLLFGSCLILSALKMACNYKK